MNDEKLVEFMAGLDGWKIIEGKRGWSAKPPSEPAMRNIWISKSGARNDYPDYLESRDAALRVAEKLHSSDRAGFGTCLWQVMDCPYNRGTLVFAKAKQICIALAKQFEVYDEEEPEQVGYKDHHSDIGGIVR